MGQYFIIVNLDKRQRLEPMAFGQLNKLMEQCCVAPGIMSGLAILLADGNGRGGGDHKSDSPLIGSWAGDRIVFAGDEADAGKFLEKGGVRYEGSFPNLARHRNERILPNLHEFADDDFEDISMAVRRVLEEDSWIKAHLEPPMGGYEKEPPF